MIVPTFTATIFVGQKGNDGYKHRAVAEKVIQSYCEGVGLCVHVYDVRYIYTNGWEDGFAVGLINYPRFPAEPETIKAKALELAERLKTVMEQFRVTVVMSDETVMIGPGI